MFKLTTLLFNALSLLTNGENEYYGNFRGIYCSDSIYDLQVVTLCVNDDEDTPGAYLICGDECPNTMHAIDYNWDCICSSLDRWYAYRPNVERTN